MLDTHRDVEHSGAVISDRGEHPIQPGDAWCSRTEREHFVTVIRPGSQPGWWVVADGGAERAVSSEEILSGFVLDAPWPETSKD